MERDCWEDPGIDDWGMWHVWRRGEVLTKFWWEDQMERDYWEDLSIDGLILKCFWD